MSMHTVYSHNFTLSVQPTKHAHLQVTAEQGITRLKHIPRVWQILAQLVLTKAIILLLLESPCSQ